MQLSESGFTGLKDGQDLVRTASLRPSPKERVPWRAEEGSVERGAEVLPSKPYSSMDVFHKTNRDFE